MGKLAEGAAGRSERINPGQGDQAGPSFMWQFSKMIVGAGSWGGGGLGGFL